MREFVNLFSYCIDDIDELQQKILNVFSEYVKKEKEAQMPLSFYFCLTYFKGETLYENILFIHILCIMFSCRSYSNFSNYDVVHGLLNIR